MRSPQHVSVHHPHLGRRTRKKTLPWPMYSAVQADLALGECANRLLNAKSFR